MFLPLQAAEHVVESQMVDLNLSVGVSLAKRFAAEVTLPLRLVRVDATFVDDSGAEIRDYESIHHRDEVLTGPGDLELWGRYRVTPAAETE